MGKNNFQALQYCRHFLKLKAPYWYGCFGQIGTQQLYDEKRRQYKEQYPPKKWTEQSFTEQFGQRVFDCIGYAVKGYLFNKDQNWDSNPVYQSKYDVSADGFYDLCTEKGPFDQIPDIPGLIVHKKGHVGIYAGKKDGKKIVLECKGHAYGTVSGSSTKWEHWCKCPWWQYISIRSWLTSLYMDILDRTPDASGLDYWSDELEEKRQTPTQVIKFFLTSPEFKNRKLSDEAFLAILYQVFFDRAPDRAGYNYWLNELKNGKTRESVIDGFVGSKEWTDMSDYLTYILNS